MQAVSKWERSEGFPDITLLPAIASFYNVTIDELMGFGKLKKEQRIREILEIFERGPAEDRITFMRGAVKEFPNEYRLIVKLIWALLNSHDQSFNNEIIALGEKILNECTDNEIRNDALGSLSIALGRFPDSHEKAREYAMMLPPQMGCTREPILIRILKGDELLKFSGEHLHALVYNIHTTIHFMLHSGGGFTLDEFIQAKETVIKFYELLYSDGDIGRDHSNISKIYRDIAEKCAEAGRFDDSINYLESAYWHAEIFDKTPKRKLNSPLMRAIEADSEYFGYWFDYELREERKKLMRLMERKCFDECRDNPQFIELEHKL
jgi:transcriptional regulator with XRE-family HTH domain